MKWIKLGLTFTTLFCKEKKSFDENRKKLICNNDKKTEHFSIMNT